MLTKFLLLITFGILGFLGSESLYSLDYGVRVGLVYGGPKPTKEVEGITGSPKISPMIGVNVEYKIWEKFSVKPQVAFALKGVSYEGKFRRDTVVEVKIGNEIGYVPTFYNVFVNGDINLAYLDFPVFLSYELFEFMNINVGIQPSILIGGRDEGSTRVVIGEGGFFEDSTYNFNNYDKINKLDFALCIGGYHKIFSRLFLQFYATFSIVELYFAETVGSKHVDRGKLYNTYFIGTIGWEF